MSNPAITYEKKTVPVLFGPWASLLVETARPVPGERILDLACGTGIVARRTAALLREVAGSDGPAATITGMDLNPAMLEVAREAAAAERCTIEWHEGTMETMPFPDGSFDLVLCQQGLQFSEDRPAALKEMHRVLRPGGRTALALWRGLDRHPFYAAFNDALVRHIGIPALATPFSLHRPDEIRALLTDAGFVEARLVERSMDMREPDPPMFVASVVETITAAIPSVQNLSEEARRNLTDAIADELQPTVDAFTRDDHVVIPFHAHLVTAVRAA